jgi:DNA-directed RNA polymerase specialized sigma24 family protein
MEAATKADKRITDAQLREAERRLIGFLHSKHFPREWIESHVPEVMAWARSDFATRLAAGREDDTVNLLVIIGYRRALKILRGDHSGPPTTSLETLFHVADESTPSPEEEAIEHDRQERVVKAMSRLPERERKLLALVYYEGMSIRQAGLHVGWKKSVADRHHQAALGRLEALLDRSLLAPEIAIPAYVVAYNDSVSRDLVMWVEGVAETIRETAMLASGRIAPPLAESGNAAAMSGAGRGAASVCGAAVLACLAGAATGVVGPGVGALTPGGGVAKEPPRSERVQEASAPTGIEIVPSATPQSAESPQPRRARTGAGETRTPATSSRPSSERPERRGSGTTAPKATAKQTVNEFGVESGEVESSPPPASSEAVEAAPISPAPPAPARPPVESSGGSSSGSSGGGSSSGSGASSEFGL